MLHVDEGGRDPGAVAGWTGLACVLVALATPVASLAQECTPPTNPEPSPRQVESIEPLHGPVGTRIQVRDEQLPVYATVHLAIGGVGGSGYQVGEGLETDEVGVLEGSVEVPDWGEPDQALFVMVFSEDYQPIAFSGPFHVTDADGIFRRTGTVVSLPGGCLGLEGADATYVLVGDEAESVEASRGQELTVEGRYGASACDCRNTMEVVRIVESDGGP